MSGRRALLLVEFGQKGVETWRGGHPCDCRSHLPPVKSKARPTCIMTPRIPFREGRDPG
jgi:hypothetical protein